MPPQQHTQKEKRQAKHIEESEKKEGRSSKRAKEIAYATVNKQKGNKDSSGSGSRSSSKGGGSSSQKAKAGAKGGRRSS